MSIGKIVILDPERGRPCAGDDRRTLQSMLRKHGIDRAAFSEAR